MRLKGYGNALCVDTAAMFIRCAGEALEDIRDGQGNPVRRPEPAEA